MTKIYFLRPDSNIPPAYSYCEGEDTDPSYIPEICILVPKQPSPSYKWDFMSESWVIDESIYFANLRSARNKELLRTDKFALEDFPLNPDDKIIALQYRQALRNAPDHATIEECIMPICPDILKS